MAAGIHASTREGQLKLLIRRRYAYAAAQPRGVLAGAQKVGLAGYSAAMLAGVPASLIDGWSGCGDLAGRVDLLDAATIADLGCGSGLDCWLISRQPGPARTIAALDLTPEILQRLKTAADTFGGRGLVPIAGDLEQLPLPAACCDLVIGNAAINLAFDPEKAFSEVIRVLRPGGRLHLMDLVRQADLPTEILSDPMGFGASLGGVQLERKLRDVIVTAGFCDIRMDDHRPFGPVTAVQIMARKP